MLRAMLKLKRAMPLFLLLLLFLILLHLLLLLLFLHLLLLLPQKGMSKNRLWRSAKIRNHTNLLSSCGKR